MRAKFSRLFVCLLLLMTITAAQASTWRSTSGNMFHFYPGGGLEAYVQGNAYYGRWWWTQNPYQFQYTVNGFNAVATVNIRGSGAVCSVYGQNPQFWNMVGSRGEKSEKPDNESWFMETVAP